RSCCAAAPRRAAETGGSGRQRSKAALLVMRYSLAIFDLDGTLVDSFPWFLRHANDVADRFGFRRISPDDIDRLRRAGTREILAHFDVPLWKLPMIARHMRRLKSQHAGELALFPGVSEMLHALKH